MDEGLLEQQYARKEQLQKQFDKLFYELLLLQQAITECNVVRVFCRRGCEVSALAPGFDRVYPDGFEQQIVWETPEGWAEVDGILICPEHSVD